MVYVCLDGGSENGVFLRLGFLNIRYLNSLNFRS